MKKELFYKTKRNKNNQDYYLEQANGYKQTYINETGITLILYFDKTPEGWSITEHETGAHATVKTYATLTNALIDARQLIKILFNIWNNEGIKQAKKIKNDLLNQL